MNKNKKNRKGFTIVELVIVIAVIGILATVLVPTFGGVIEDARKSADLQAAKNAYTQALIDGQGTATDPFEYEGEYYTYTFTNGAWSDAEANS